MIRRPVTVHDSNKAKILAEVRALSGTRCVERIAAKYNIAPSTIYRWKQQQKRLKCEAIAS